MAEIKEQPSSQIVERTIVGAILFEYKSMEIILPWIRTPEVFYYNQNRTIWLAAVELYKDKRKFDLTILIEYITDKYGKDAVDGLYMADCMQQITSTNNLEEYCRILYFKYVRRKLIEVSKEINDASFEHGNIEKLLEEHRRLTREYQNLQPEKFKSIDQIIKDTVNYIYVRDNIIPYNIPAFDKPAGGMTRKEVTVFGGRPSHGKTTAMLNVVRALVPDYKVMVFNREMTNIEAMKKLISMECATLKYDKMRFGEFTKDEREELEIATEVVGQRYKNLIMYDEVDDLLTVSNEIARYKPDVVMDDYIQLIKPPDPTKDRRFQLEDIMREYKWLAKMENISVFLVSQLNREIERRYDPRPKMSDFAESGAIEQIAEAALFVFRGYVFDSEEYNPYELEIIAAKVRYGKIGYSKIGFNGEKCRLYHSAEEAEKYS